MRYILCVNSEFIAYNDHDLNTRWYTVDAQKHLLGDQMVLQTQCRNTELCVDDLAPKSSNIYLPSST